MVGFISGIAIYKRVTAGNPAEQIAKYADQKQVKAEVQNFREKIGAITSVDALFKNRKLLTFALGAFGLESQLTYPARLQQVLKSDLSERTSLANRLGDDRYRQFNRAIGASTEGEIDFTDPAKIDTIVNQYLQAKFESSAGDQDPAVSDALYFRRKIGSLSKTGQLFSDPVLFSVVKTTLNIPDSAVAANNAPQLTSWIERNFDVGRARDQAYVDRFVQRYIALKDAETQKNAGNPLLDILS